MRKLTSSLCFTLLLLLSACTQVAKTPYLERKDFVENWLGCVAYKTDAWSRSASNWFKAADVRSVPESPGLDKAHWGAQSIKVAPFTALNLNGDFQVQLVGGSDTDAVTLYGPRDAIAAIHVESSHGILCVNVDKKAPPTLYNVVVRINMRQLTALQHQGCGNVEGLRIASRGLELIADGSGAIYLAGRLQTASIEQNGEGNVNLFGVYGDEIELVTTGHGDTNLTGDIGLSWLEHHGKNNIQIIGQRSVPLGIEADGEGEISLNGDINLSDLSATDKVRIFLYRVTSNNADVQLYHQAVIGWTGSLSHLNLIATHNSIVYGRKLLLSHSHLRLQSNAHVNMTGIEDNVINASGNSSVYYIGDDDQLTSFTHDYAVILRL